MGLFSLEHHKAAYWADFAVYDVLALSMAAGLVWTCPPNQGWSALGSVALGVAVWSPLEYLLHRFVLHGLKPFSRWHARHHERPKALICSPTVLSTSLIASLFFLPLLWLGNTSWAMGLTLGLLIGYQAYALTHHLLHHWHVPRNTGHAGAVNRHWQNWWSKRRRWHARHHHSLPLSHFGVTTGLWDWIFESTARQPPATATIPPRLVQPLFDSEQTFTARFFTTGHWRPGAHHSPVMRAPTRTPLGRASSLPALVQPMRF